MTRLNILLSLINPIFFPDDVLLYMCFCNYRNILFMYYTYRNLSNSADRHQRVLLHTEILLPLQGKVIKLSYHKVPKFSDARKLCCSLPKIQTKRPNLSVFHQNDANEITNSVDPDQTAPLGTV